MALFNKASRKRVYLKVGLMGPSGSGKTYSALILAQSLAKGGQIAYIDTENGSASLYSHLTDFDVADIAPPFDPEKYIGAINEAVAAGYSVVVIDSFTHAWKYLLDKKEKLDARGGRQNNYTNWGPVKAEAERLKEAILQSRVHIIACMRSKTEYAQEGGKVTKLGMAAVQEPDVEYEFTTVFNIDMEHNAMPSKDRTGLFKNRIERITTKTGDAFMDWMDSADSQDTYTPPAATADVSTAEAVQLATAPKPATELHPGAAFLKGIGMNPGQLSIYKEEASHLGFKPYDLAAIAKGQGVATSEDLDRYLDAIALAKDNRDDINAKYGLEWWKIVATAREEGIADTAGLVDYLVGYDQQKAAS